jgi:hypothetical protein
MLVMKKLLLLLFIPALAIGQEADYESYDDCILDRLAGISSDLAAQALIKACENKFDDETVTVQPTIENNNEAFENSVLTNDDNIAASINNQVDVEKETVEVVTTNNDEFFEGVDVSDAIFGSEEGYENIVEDLALDDVDTSPEYFTFYHTYPDYEITEPLVKDYVYRRRLGRYGDDKSFSVLVSHLNGYSSDPSLTEPYDPSKPEQSSATYNESLTADLYDELIGDINSWALRNKYDYLNTPIKGVFGDEFDQDLYRVSEDLKYRRVRGRGIEFQEATYEKLQLLPTNYLLVINIDLISYGDWIRQNIESDGEVYEQDLTTPTIARSVLQVAGAFTGLGGMIASSLVYGSIYSNISELWSLNIISAYLVSKNGIVMRAFTVRNRDYNDSQIFSGLLPRKFLEN